MAKRSFRGRGISESQRRKKSWFVMQLATGAVGAGNVSVVNSVIMTTPAIGMTAGSSAAVLVSATSDPEIETGEEFSTLPNESTILRIRGSLNFPKNEATEGDLTGVPEFSFAFGMGVTDVRSLVEGTPPQPITDAGWDGWMFLRQSTVSPLDSEGTVFDVKAMRKIKSGDAFFMIGQGVSGGATGVSGGMWQVDARLLMLLP